MNGDLAIVLPRMIRGASRSIDIRVREASDFGMSVVDLARIADSSLRRRCLLPQVSFEREDFPPGHYSFERLRDIARMLHRSGWELQINLPAGMQVSTVIVDQSSAVAIEWLHEPPRVIVTQEPYLVDHYSRRFEHQWEVSAGWDKAAVLYIDAQLLEGSAVEAKIATISEVTWESLIQELASTPEDLHTLSPRKFEELIAELLRREGFSTNITPISRDGGRDILAYQETAVGTHLFLVECKRRGRRRPVDVSIVRALYGVVMQERATAGLLVTTSYFTRAALKFREPLQFQINLRDYNYLVSWLAKHRRDL